MQNYVKIPSHNFAIVFQIIYYIGILLTGTIWSTVTTTFAQNVSPSQFG